MKNYIHIISATLILLSATQTFAQNNYILYDDIPYNTISGVNQNLLNLDVYKPTLVTGNRPVMIYIHGGYWSAGDKSSVGSKAQLFTDSGYVFVSINYRLSPDPVDTLSSTAVRFPIHPQDCADAIKWLFDNISTYSGDTSKVSLIGHSAGAHLVLLLSTNHSFLQNAGVNPNQIKCSCSLDCGVFDLIEELQQAGNNILRRVPLINAFGLDTSLYDDVSPQYNIEAGKDIPWLHMVHQNTVDRIYGNTRFRDSLIANGYSDVSLLNANPYNHGTINVALGQPWDSIGLTSSVMQFFGNCLTNNLTTGISDFDNSFAEINLFPNPTNSTLFIKTENQTSFQYSMTNSIGQLIMQGQMNGNSLDVSNLQNGIYFIRLKDEKGQWFNSKFIKE